MRTLVSSRLGFASIQKMREGCRIGGGEGPRCVGTGHKQAGSHTERLQVRFVPNASRIVEPDCAIGEDVNALF